MTLLSSLQLQGAAALLAVVGNMALVMSAEDPDPLKVMFINEFPTQTIDLYWENPSFDDNHPGRRRFEARIPPRGGWHASETFIGHEFSYEVNGQRHYVVPPPGNVHGEQYLILAGHHKGYRVRCETTVNSQQSVESFDIIVKPYWAPRAAARFMELVREKYYDGVAINRVVPNFLLQLGIARDHATRTKEREVRMWDDFPKVRTCALGSSLGCTSALTSFAQKEVSAPPSPPTSSLPIFLPKGRKFEPGMISFAGSGHDSRTTEIFVLMPGAPKKQVENLGENSWEIPFALIDGDINKSALKRVYSGYGDMPPFGNGPDTSKIYEADGYTKYLPKKFPLLDYINSCYIVDEVGISGDQLYEEF